MYILDANAFISANNLWYGLDFCPAYWDWLVQAEKRGLLMSIREIGDQIKDAEEQRTLLNWRRSNEKLFKPRTFTLDNFQAISQWVQDSKRPYFEDAIEDFWEDPDAYLIAEALARGGIVVTYERSAPESKKNIKIPDVCAGLNIECIKPHDMLRREGARFIL